MTAVAAIVPLLAFESSAGAPLVGGKLYTYLSGTSTPATTWQDAAQTVTNTNPVILNARGECRVMLAVGTAYRFVLRDASDVIVWSVDNVQGGSGLADLANSTDPALGDALVAVKAPVAGAVATTQHEVNARELWLEDFGAKPDGSDSSGPWALAMVACAALGRTKLRIGRGVFSFASAVVMGVSSLTVEGAGPGATVLRSTFDAAGFVTATGGGTLTDVHMRDLTVEQQVGSTPTQTLLSFANCRRWSVRNVAFSGGYAPFLATGCSIGGVDQVSWNALAWGEGTRPGFGFDQCVGLSVTRLTAGVEATGSGSVVNAVSGIRLNNCTDVAVIAPRVASCRRGINLPNGATRVAIIEPNVDGCQYGIVGDTGGAPYADVSINGGTVLTNSGTAPAYGVLVSGVGSISGLAVRGLAISGLLATGDGVIINGTTLVTGVTVEGTRTRTAGTTGNAAIAIGFSGATPTAVTVTGNTIGSGSAAVGNGIDVTTVGGAVTGNAMVNSNIPIRIRAATRYCAVQGNSCLSIVDDAASPTNLVQGTPVAFRVHRSAAVTLTPTAGGSVIVPLDSKDYDPYSTFDAAVNYRWAPPGGTVQLSACVEVQNNTGGASEIIAAIFKDGAEFARGVGYSVANAAFARLSVAIVDRNAGASTYQLRVISTAAGNVQVQTNTQLSGVLIDR